jgi:hypothetical protein
MATGTTRRCVIWDTVCSYIRITLTVGTKKSLNGTIEKQGHPEYYDGTEILEEVSKLKIVLGKGEGAVPALANALWKEKLVF